MAYVVVRTIITAEVAYASVSDATEGVNGTIGYTVAIIHARVAPKGEGVCVRGVDAKASAIIVHHSNLFSCGT